MADNNQTLSTENEPAQNPDANREAIGDSGQIVSGKVVKYIGTSDVREINEEAWRSLGSKTGLTRWRAGNRWSVDAADLDDAALSYLETDRDFVIVDATV